MIRSGHPADAEGAMRVVRAWPTHFVPAAYPYIEADIKRLPSLVWVDEDKIQGFAVWVANAYEIELLWLAVHPGATRRGIARQLVAAAESMATTQQLFILKTATPDSVVPNSQFCGMAYEGTLRFFHAMGFRVAGRLDAYWGPANHCFVLTKALNPSTDAATLKSHSC
jgi:ribosomal protein S18 acetylase RimI-like enzyme